jgi:hypothetical protein
MAPDKVNKEPVAEEAERTGVVVACGSTAEQVCLRNKSGVTGTLCLIRAGTLSGRSRTSSASPPRQRWPGDLSELDRRLREFANALEKPEWDGRKKGKG